MTNGDRVRVFPLGEPAKAAAGTLMLCSSNDASLAISFGEDYVPFISAATGMALHPDHGKMLLLSRMEDGTWADVFTNRQFELEADEDHTR